MVKFEVQKIDGSEEEIQLMSYLPARTGMKARSKLGLNLESDGKQADIEMENPLEQADSALAYVVEEMFDKSDVDVSIDELAYESFQEIAQYYWKQVEGEKAKN